MASNNFGEFLTKPGHGWFVERFKDLKVDIDKAFTNIEGGLSRNTLPLFIHGSGDADDDHPILVDTVSPSYITIGAYNIVYGLGYWTIVCGDGLGGLESFRVYGLEGTTAKDYVMQINANTGATWAVSFNATTKKLLIRMPNDNSGTLAGLRAALMATPAVSAKFAISGDAAWTLINTQVVAETAITAPATWGTGLVAMALLQETPIFRIEALYMVLYLEPDFFGTFLDAFVPCSIIVDVWQDGQLMEFSHKVMDADAE